MTEPKAYHLRATTEGQRVDQFLSKALDQLSRSRAHQLITAGHVLVQGRLVRPSHQLQLGDHVQIELPEPEPFGLAPEPMPLRVVYEDDDMVVIDKPPGLVVHPGPGHAQHTLVHALLARYPNLPGIGGTQRPGIVHRLDLDTSGLIMVAKSDRGMAALSSQLTTRTLHKGYFALLSATINPPDGLIDSPIGRDSTNRLRMAIVERGRSAGTRFYEIARVAGHSFVVAIPLTGRTHQIRVHFAAIGAPIAGDELYGGESLGDRQFLHAFALQFARPSDGEPIQCWSDLPPDLAGTLSHLLLQQRLGGRSLDAEIERMLRLARLYFSQQVIT